MEKNYDYSENSSILKYYVLIFIFNFYILSFL